MGMKMHPPLAFLFLATVGLIWINAPGIASEKWQEAALLTSGNVLTAPLLFLCLVFAQADNKDIS